MSQRIYCGILSSLFLTNRNSSSQNDIVLIENGKTIFEDNAPIKTFHDHYVNIVEKSCKIKPLSFVSFSSAIDGENIINEIIQYYVDHPSIIKIAESLTFTQLTEDSKFE